MRISLLIPIFTLIISSCSLLKPKVLPTDNENTKALTFIKNGELIENPIEKDATPPVGHANFNKPVIINQIQENEVGWELGSFNGMLNAENASIQYAMLSKTNNLYFPEIDKNNVFEIRIYKDSTKWCKVVNYKFIRQRVANRPPASIAFLMDHSGSMGSIRADYLQEGLDSAINYKQPNDEIALYKFDNHSLNLITSKDKLLLQQTLRPKNGLDGFGSATAMQDAMLFAIEKLKASMLTDKQIFLITDGQENSSSVATNLDTLINYARKNKIVVNTIGFGDYVNEDYLSNISNKTGGYFEHIYSSEELKHIFSHSYQRINNHFKLTFRPCMFSDTLTVETTVKVGKTKYKNTKLFTYELNLGTIVDFQVLFEKDKATIDDIYLPQINEMIEYLKAHPTMELELRGHTDSDGDNSYNLKLSQKRADAIKNYMVKNGIASNRLTAVGYGEKEPIYVEDSEENMYLNRRTEAKIIKF